MNTLADAWHWYESTKASLKRIRRLGRKHWGEMPWENGAIGRDDEFRTLEASDIEQDAAASLELIDDLAVVVLFSVFEAIARTHILTLVGPEAERLSDPLLKQAAEDAIRGVREGSFSRRVLEPLKLQGRISAELVTHVNQVREYRNWVAHGRRDNKRTNNVIPTEAYERLREFLEA